TGGGVALNEIDTGSRSIDDGLRAIVKSEGGAISSTGGPATNITAWATNLESDTSIGSASDAITTNVDVLNASTQNGGIFVQNQQGDLIVGTVSARETVTVSGMPTASMAIGNSAGNVTLSNGAAGTHDVYIGTEQDLLLTAGVSA